MDANVYIESVNKWYTDEVHAVKNMSMEIQAGEFLVFVGPSGCGKTTLLRMIAGLERIDGGTIKIGERVINKVPPKNRDIAMVFQNYALYPTMSVFDNIAFPLQMRRVRKAAIHSSVTDVGGKLDLLDYLARKPAALSGGQRQRVALARAMVRKPKLFLMDEPLSNLDAKLRVNMRREIVALQRDLGVTTVYVTHDQVEAMTMGSRIAVMHDGVLQQIGTPDEVYNAPANVFTALFIGSPQMNMWNDCDAPHLLRTVYKGDKIAYNGPVAVGIRPEHVLVVPRHAEGAVPMQIESIEKTGRETMVFMSGVGQAKPVSLTMAANADFNGKIGESISIMLIKEKLHFFDKGNGKRFTRIL